MNQRLEDDHLLDYAVALGLDADLFGTCRSGDVASRVARDAELASALQLRGTPIFLLGSVATKGGALHVSEIVTGARPLAEFEEILERLLSQ